MTINIKKDVNFAKLTAKYMNVHLHDANADKEHNFEVYRVGNSKWHQITSTAEQILGIHS